MKLNLPAKHPFVSRVLLVFSGILGLFLLAAAVRSISNAYGVAISRVMFCRPRSRASDDLVMGVRLEEVIQCEQ